jgi:hypothetical protein
MFMRSIASRGVSAALRRSLSTAAVDSPKLTIARNIMLLQELSKAKTEADLQKVFDAPLPMVELNDLPVELAHCSAYFSTDSISAAEPYIPDPTAWQNMPFGQYVYTEVQRAETWPFIVGLLLVNSLFFYAEFYIYPPLEQRDSKYLQLLESHEGAYKLSVAKHEAEHAHH